MYLIAMISIAFVSVTIVYDMMDEYIRDKVGHHYDSYKGVQFFYNQVAIIQKRKAIMKDVFKVARWN